LILYTKARIVLTKIVTVEQMQVIEKAADASGLSYAQMMENAGCSIAHRILEHWTRMEGKSVVILVGSGNNGGDGLVVGHYLHDAGAEIHAYLSKQRTAEDKNLKRLKEDGCEIVIASEDAKRKKLRQWVSKADFVIDAVLGTGFKLPLRGNAKSILGEVSLAMQDRDRTPIIVGVDCPSGLDCDHGEVADEALSCDLTVTLAAAKPGLFIFPGANKVGKLFIGDIGIDQELKEIASVELELATADTVKAWVPARPKNAHKGTFGRALIVAGSVNYPGSAALAALGAYRVGAGLVTLAVPAPVQMMLAPQVPEATWIVLPDELGVIAEKATDVLVKELKNIQAMLVGPGFGKEPTTANFLQQLLSGESTKTRGKMGLVPTDREKAMEPKLEIPCVIDADGLRLLSKISSWPSLLPPLSILTPHPGEMSAMTGVAIDDIQTDRVKHAQKAADEWGHIVVLKGAFTVIAAPDGKCAVLPFATPALASAGTGDVLAGVITGLRAQGVGPYEAAVLGAYLHGRAGELAAEMVGSLAGVIAGDVVDSLALAMAELNGGLSRI
jgi:hydroxyethylthiazole kinase-like uncharacterized protein yjeF